MKLIVQSEIQTEYDVILYFRDGARYAAPGFIFANTRIETHVVGRTPNEIQKVEVAYTYDGHTLHYEDRSTVTTDDLLIKLTGQDWATMKLREMALNAEVDT